jgi:CrcB protein
MDVLVWVGVGVLGGAGALGRFLLDGVVSARAGRQFPLGTLAVNLSGAFLLGLLVGLPVGDRALLLAGTATLGSYTTFSTWVFESHRLGEDGELRLGALNLAVSLVGGLVAAAAGRAIGAAL